MIYIAGKLSEREVLQREKQHLQRLGFAVSATWLDAVDGDPEVAADRDLQEVWGCDAFIIDTTNPSTNGGREAELGAALTSQRPIYRVGPIRNVFHSKADFAFESWVGLYAHLEELS